LDLRFSKQFSSPKNRGPVENYLCAKAPRHSAVTDVHVYVHRRIPKNRTEERRALSHSEKCPMERTYVAYTWRRRRHLAATK